LLERLIPSRFSFEARRLFLSLGESNEVLLLKALVACVGVGQGHAHACSAGQLLALCVHHLQKTFRLVERTDEWREMPEELKLVVFGRGEGMVAGDGGGRDEEEMQGGDRLCRDPHSRLKGVAKQS